LSKRKSDTLNIGMIGAGGIAGLHVDCLKKIAGVNVLAACDVAEKSVKNTAEKYDIPHTFTDYKELLKMKELDAVSVCTPNFFHAEPTIAALEAGKHVMVEKPMAMNAKEAQAMVDAAKKAKRLLVIGFQHRYSPSAQTLKRMVNDDRLGKILYVRCQALRRRGIPNWGVFGRKELQGGGPMIDIGVHILETAHYVMGQPRPVAASGQCYTYLGDKKSDVVSQWPNWDFKTYSVEDLAVGMVRFDNGATLVIESSFAAHIEKDLFTFTIMGEKGGACFDPLKVFTDLSGTMVNVEPSYVGSDNMWNLKMRDWVESIRTGKKPTSPGEDGLVVQKMLDGVYKSSEAGKEVRIN